MDIDDLIGSLRKKQHTQEKASDKLKKAWISERMCPEILPFAEAETHQVTEEIKALVAYIDEHSFELENSVDRDIKINLLLIETHLERLKFIVRSYIRARVSKIENHIVYYSNPNHQQNLSSQEAEYAFNHFQLQYNLYQASFMSTWPETYTDLQSENNEQLVDAPRLEKPVVVKITRDSFIGEEPAKKGELWMTPYNVVREYLGTDMELV